MQAQLVRNLKQSPLGIISRIGRVTNIDLIDSLREHHYNEHMLFPVRNVTSLISLTKTNKMENKRVVTNFALLKYVVNYIVYLVKDNTDCTNICFGSFASSSIHGMNQVPQTPPLLGEDFFFL